MANLYFNTINPVKINEIREIFKESSCKIRFLSKAVVEILSSDIEEVIKEKAASAYKQCRIPIIVEHGALIIDYFNGFPGALSKPMWNLMADKICKSIPSDQERTAKAVSAVCFCDGKKRLTVFESISGAIALERRGDNGFQWDPIFVPVGETKTFGEMCQTEKLKFSQAARAYTSLFGLLLKEGILDNNQYMSLPLVH